MKNFIIIVLSVFFSFALRAQDSNEVTVTGEVSLNHNGIAPVPSFALGKPAVMSFLQIKKGAVSYSNVAAFAPTEGLRAWFWDNWFHYQTSVGEKMTAKVGINWSHFFDTPELNGRTVIEATNYFNITGDYMYAFNDKHRIGFDYWWIKGIQGHTLQGHMFRLASSHSFPVGGSVAIEAKPSVFYLDLTGGGGLFGGGKAILVLKEKLLIGAETTVPLALSTSKTLFNGFVGFRYRL